MLALAAWEFRNCGSIRPEFERALSTVIETEGSAGRESRAILAAHRPLLEGIANGWLENQAAVLFREGALAQETFDLTVKWARPTPWLYREFADELFDAALRGVDNACRLLIVAALNKVEGYDLDTLIKRLGKDPAALATAVEDSAFLVQRAEPEAPHLTVAAQLWTLLLDADRSKAPPQVLTGLGRWAFVDNIDDHEWAQLTLRTLDATDGQIQHPISVVDRVARIPPDTTSAVTTNVDRVG
ncbi:hypothetical protein ETD83_21445 [Actinomadura soli]|uniref:Uncharacterized protein n=1 Tax=Actinomadura soli TaxID=2508997 RepID=A0A5C4JAR1_9ACTN|nr:hypothetical protein [Actinomadura soli]TMQ96270.1 hypothetical protein ETD83_21445 [Actinomadura soli]